MVVSNILLTFVTSKQESMRGDIIEVIKKFLKGFCEVSKNEKDEVLIKVNKREDLLFIIWDELTTKEQFDILHEFIEGNIHSVRFRV